MAKLAGEHYMRAFTRVYGIQTVTLRYFNVFGPYQDPTSHYSGVLAIFCRKMLAGEQPTIYGDGEQSRDFTYIDNVVAGQPAGRRSARRKGFRPHDECRYRHGGIRSTRPLSSSAASPAIAANQPMQSHAPAISAILWPTSALPANCSAMQPSVDFPEGLRRTVEWYRSAKHSI